MIKKMFKKNTCLIVYLDYSSEIIIKVVNLIFEQSNRRYKLFKSTYK